MYICDNKAAIAMVKNPAFHSRTKHILHQVSFLTRHCARGSIEIKHCGTKEQVANIMTKALPFGKPEYFRSQMGVTNFEGRESVESHPSK